MRRIFTILSLLIITYTVALAQPGDPGGNPDVPISGVEILLALGGILGIRKFFSSKRPK